MVKWEKIMKVKPMMLLIKGFIATFSFQYSRTSHLSPSTKPCLCEYATHISSSLTDADRSHFMGTHLAAREANQQGG